MLEQLSILVKIHIMIRMTQLMMYAKIIVVLVHIIMVNVIK